MNWAANPSKLERAKEEVLNSGQPMSEEAVKKVYVRLAGRLLEKPASPEPKKEEAPKVEKPKAAKPKAKAKAKK